MAKRRKNRPRNAPKRKAVRTADERQPRVVETPSVQEGSPQRLRFGVALAAIALVSAAVIQNVTKERSEGVVSTAESSLLAGNNDSDNSVANAQAVEVAESLMIEAEEVDATHIFTPRKELEDIDRISIPSRLAESLAGMVSYLKFPENYNPKKPNLYLIGNNHVTSDMNYAEKTKAREFQKRVLSVVHVLKEFGVNQQFLEGVSRGIEMKHDADHPDIAEEPINAMSGYRSSGVINRAYVAVEGVYEDEMRSLGADDLSHHLKGGRRTAKLHFGNAKKAVVLEMARVLDIDLQEAVRRHRGSIESLLAELQSMMKSHPLSSADLERLKVFLLSQPSYQAWLEFSAKDQYEKIQARNVVYSKTFTENISTGDGVMIVGGKHLKHLASIVDDYNPVIIVPEMTDDLDVFTDYFASFFDIDDYKASIIAHDLYVFGLGPKPTHSVWSLDF